MPTERGNRADDTRRGRYRKAVDERAVAAKIEVVQAERVVASRFGREGQAQILAFGIDDIGHRTAVRVANRDGRMQIDSESSSKKIAGDRPGFGRAKPIAIDFFDSR